MSSFTVFCALNQWSDVRNHWQHYLWKPVVSNLTGFLATVEVKMGVWPRIGLKRGQVTKQKLWALLELFLSFYQHLVLLFLWRAEGNFCCLLWFVLHYVLQMWWHLENIWNCWKSEKNTKVEKDIIKRIYKYKSKNHHKVRYCTYSMWHESKL